MPWWLSGLIGIGLCVFMAWGIIHEEKLIEFEDKTHVRFVKWIFKPTGCSREYLKWEKGRCKK